MRPGDRYTYVNAGFNGFMNRSLKANPAATSLRGGISSGPGRPINLDLQQMVGALGDKLTIGKLVLNGKDGNIEIHDDNDTVVGLIGNLDV